MTAGAADRPRRLVVVVGTATEVGKTWVTARLVEALRDRGVAAVARKPAQSFDPTDSEPTDAAVLAAAGGEDPEAVCPEHRWYPVPMAPPMATDVLGLDAPTLAEVLDELRWPPGVDVGFVETVGGVRSPITADADSRDLVGALAADAVLLVADAALGTIDRVRLAVAALAPAAPVVFLNRFDPGNDLHRRNRGWLSDRDGYDVVIDSTELTDRLDGTRATH